ncbi:hypothetical protein KDE13_04525 [Campylobacter sp. faydin G-140]|nr:hypothetical protein [Campylobacter anatolicus]MBR8465625.1 hypothetical protein [Campylobacter anatolicus]
MSLGGAQSGMVDEPLTLLKQLTSIVGLNRSDQFIVAVSYSMRSDSGKVTQMRDK